MRAEPARVWASLTGVLPLWSFVLLVLLGLPWVAYRLRKRLRGLVASALAACAQHQEPPGVGVALLLVGSAALWPAYLALLAWGYGQFLPEPTAEAALGAALLSGLQVSALVLWIGLVGRAILQPEGWGQRFWGLSPSLCHFLQRVVTVGCLAALVLLVPHHVLLAAPGGAAMAANSLALARALFLTFQVVLLVLVGIVGRRGSPLLTTVLARSRQEQGLWWRLWPLVYVALLGGGMATITLHVLGYLYAARYIWSRVLESLLVILVLQWLLRLLGWRALHRGVGTVFRTASRMLQRQTAEQVEDRACTMMRRIWNALWPC